MCLGGLRRDRSGSYAVLTPDEYIAELPAAPYNSRSSIHVAAAWPIDLAWSSLRLFEHEVIQAQRAYPVTRFGGDRSCACSS